MHPLAVYVRGTAAASEHRIVIGHVTETCWRGRNTSLSLSAGKPANWWAAGTKLSAAVIAHGDSAPVFERSRLKVPTSVAWCIPPLQAVLDDVHDPPDTRLIIHTQFAMRQRKIWLDPIQLFVRQHSHLARTESNLPSFGNPKKG